MRYPDADLITVVHDQLNTHVPSAISALLSQPLRSASKTQLEFHYTPKHGSWLNMAEIKCLSRQCLNRRIPDKESLQREVGAWSNDESRVSSN